MGTPLGWDMAKLVGNHVRSQGANVIVDNGVAEFLGELPQDKSKEIIC